MDENGRGNGGWCDHSAMGWGYPSLCGGVQQLYPVGVPDAYPLNLIEMGNAAVLKGGVWLPVHPVWTGAGDGSGSGVQYRFCEDVGATWLQPGRPVAARIRHGRLFAVRNDEGGR